ncbi:cation:proton antiporter [Domibacillus robiginosus]|uniref:cation:proton antiporter n=1 Tax=Domibacillus robiginosus TaxID=1071054 RepID=UPI00067CA88E|nr:sodium:proton antiporter [Domibacillus robiginosus]
MFDSLLFYLMITLVVGIASQWIAWRYRLPAIVVMSVAGLLIGPLIGWFNPKDVFGDLFGPIISAAVAIILFEGSLNLDFREVKTVRQPIRRIVTLGAFIAWIAGSLAAHYVAGLSLAVSFVIGGLFIVTGPTVILPLLRQAKLKPRTAAILKWEGIVVDPFGALLALFAFELIKFFTGEESVSTFINFLFGSAFAVILGIVFGLGLGKALEKGRVPEYLKSPAVFVVVIACFTIADEAMHETGLLAVTAMGMVMANMHISSIRDMRHFKENISILLISTIFIMLTASLTRETLMQIFDFRIIAFVLIMLLVVRPLSIWLSTIGTDMTRGEKTLVGWIAPRGIVALTVSGYFAQSLFEAGYEDAAVLTPLTFALVFSTVVAHGFSIGWLARKLHLASTDRPGVLLVGGNTFTARLGKTLQDLDIPVLVADDSWQRLHAARQANLPVYHGEILSESTEYHLELTPYEYMIAATSDEAYNALVCSTFVPEMGRVNLYQIAAGPERIETAKEFNKTVGGKVLFDSSAHYQALTARAADYVFRKTELTERFGYDSYLKELDENSLLLFLVKPSGKLAFYTRDASPRGEAGDIVVSLMPPVKEMAKAKEKIAEQRRSQ